MRNWLEYRQISFFEYIKSILPQINVEVTKNVRFSVICVHFRRVFVKNLKKICLVPSRYLHFQSLQ